MAAALPVLTALAIFGLYNYARFDSPFEFGIRYQLAGFDSTKAVFFNLARIGGNLYLFLIYPPKLSATFPFLTLVRPWLEPMGRYLLFEPVAGLLWFSPALVLLPLGIPFLCRRGYARRWELALFLGALVFTAAALLFLDASLVAIMRYQADFAGLLFVPTALVIAGLWQWGRRVISVRVAYLALFCFLAAATVLPTGLAGLSSEYGGLDLTEPGQFKALQTLFGPVSSALVRWGVQP